MKSTRRIGVGSNPLAFLLLCSLLWINVESICAQTCTTTTITAGSTVNGNLTDTDCNAPHRSTSKADLYTFTGTAGQRVTIAMEDREIRGFVDPYLILTGPTGNIVNNPGLDDDRGGNGNALISDLLLSSSGTYTIEATAYHSTDRGAYALALTVTGSGTDNAAFVANITIPDNTQMTPGQHFTKTWRLRNTGSTIWSSSYTLAFVSGPQMSAPNSVGVASAVPNSIIDVSVPMIAPSTPGTYQGFWRMKNPSGQSFGTQIWVQIIVVGGSGGCSPISIAVGSSVNGTLSDTDCNAPHRTASKADLYTFQGTAGQRVTVSMSSSAIDSYLILIGPSGAIINDPSGDDDRGGNRNALISNVLLSSTGTYSIEATAYNASDRGAYLLTLTLGSAICNPTAIASGPTLNASLTESDCSAPHRSTSKADLYTFTATAGQHVTIAQRSTTIDSYLILVGPTGNIVNSPDLDDDAGGGRDALINDLSLPSSGTYTIEATAFNSSDRGSYTLTLSIAGANCISVPISPGSPVNGNLSDSDCNAPHRTSSKADLFRFTGTVGQRVTISMNSSVIDSYLILVGPSGSVVNDPTADDDRGGNRNALVSNLSLPASGTYTIEATSYNSSDRGAYTLTLTSGNQGGEPCLVFVHGSRAADANPGYDWSQDWLAGRDYWRSYTGLIDLIDGTDTVSTDPADDFIRAATNNLTRPHFVVRYNGAAEWWNNEAAGQVAREIVRATNGEFDGPIGQSNRSQCTTAWQNGGVFWVIAHSGGGTVMDFILGNSSPSDLNFNFNGPYDQVASRIAGVFSVAGAHRGSSLADTICNPGTGCNIAGHNCTNARKWLQTDEVHQVYFYSSSPAKTVWLTGGYAGGPTSACLPGEDDAVLQYASIFACSGDGNAAYNNSNVCGNNSKQNANFRNLDGAYETHDDIRNNRNTSIRERRTIPDGIWECNGQPCTPNVVARSNLSTASFLDLLLTVTFTNQSAALTTQPSSQLPGNDLISKSLVQATAEGYRKLARYPLSSSPIDTTQDPIAMKLTVNPRTALSSGREEPSLTVYSSAISFEAPEPIVLNAYLSRGESRIKAKRIRGFIIDENGKEIAVLKYRDNGKAGDALAGDGIYTASFAPPQGQERSYKGIYSVRVQAFTLDGEERVADTSFQYSAPDSQLTGHYEDQIVEGSLQIRAQVNVTARGRFHLEGTLYTMDGRPIAWAQNALVLDPGLHYIPLTFYGLAMREKGLDGPYVLKCLSLSTTTEMPNSKNRLAENVHTTGEYRAVDFTDQPFNEPSLVEEYEKLERSLEINKAPGAFQSRMFTMKSPGVVPTIVNPTMQHGDQSYRTWFGKAHQRNQE